MADVNFTGTPWTWANNRGGEGYVDEKLDSRFFVSHEWLYQCPNTIVHHINKQSSNHCLILLEDQLDKPSAAKRFYFDKRFLELLDFEKTVEQAWLTPQSGTPMFQVCARIKECRIGLLKLWNQHKMNSGKAI